MLENSTCVNGELMNRLLTLHHTWGKHYTCGGSLGRALLRDCIELLDSSSPGAQAALSLSLRHCDAIHFRLCLV